MMMYIFTLLYIIPSTQHKSLSYRYMFRLNKSSTGVSKNHKTYYNITIIISLCFLDTPEDDLLSRNM